MGVPKIFDVHKYFAGKKWFQYACTTYQHELGEGVRGPGAAVRPLVVVSLPVRGVLHQAAPPGLNSGKILLPDSCDLETFKNSLLNPSSLHVEWATIVIMAV